MTEEHKFNYEKMYVDEKGYPRFKDSDILVHRFNANKFIRKIKDGEEVHHVDGNKIHFHSENLIILSKEDHIKVENEIRKQKNLNYGYILIIVNSICQKVVER